MVKLVQLEDEDGTKLEEVIGSPRFLSDLGVDEFRLLHYVDPWGDTIFNRQQANAILSEWDRLESRAQRHGQHDLWLALKQLLSKAQSEPHLYVRFEGD